MIKFINKQNEKKVVSRIAIPFFGVSLGYTIFYLSLIVLIPLSTLFWTLSSATYNDFISIMLNDRTLSAFKVTFSSAFISAICNMFIGTILAWVLVRYDFIGKNILDALIDIPFILPTAIAGITLTSIYIPKFFVGAYLESLGIKVVYSQLGIIIALIFVGIPFAVRSVEPILRELEPEIEEAAYCLGATRFQIFIRIILPTIWPSILTGFILSFARGIGEYGSVIFIAGNMPKSTEIISLLIYIKLEQYDYIATAVIATTSLLISFIILLSINLFQTSMSPK